MKCGLSEYDLVQVHIADDKVSICPNTSTAVLCKASANIVYPGSSPHAIHSVCLSVVWIIKFRLRRQFRKAEGLLEKSQGGEREKLSSQHITEFPELSFPDLYIETVTAPSLDGKLRTLRLLQKLLVTGELLLTTTLILIVRKKAYCYR